MLVRYQQICASPVPAALLIRAIQAETKELAATSNGISHASLEEIISFGSVAD
jgi:hypothetical protein